MEENVIQINSAIMINVDVSVKNVMCVKVIIFVILPPCNCENGNYLGSILDDSAIICDEVIDAKAKTNDEETKTIPTNFKEKKTTCNMQNFYILLAFLLITIALLMAVISCYLIKYRAN